MVKITRVESNPQITPSFLEDTVVSLKKDYTDVCNENFKKKACGAVIGCGFCKYQYPFTDGEIVSHKLVDEEEWCYLELLLSTADPLNDRGSVRGKDLEIL